MNLVNYTLKYLYITLLIVIGIWAAIFYLIMIEEVRDSLDDGLGNDKMLVIKKVASDPKTIDRAGFEEHNYAIRKIDAAQALNTKDTYRDTLMYTINEKDMEPFRVLTTAFENNGTYYELKVVASTLEQDDLVSALLTSLIGLYIAVLISIFAINHILLRKIWVPFYRLLQQLRLFRLDRDEGITITSTKVKEFVELNDVVKRLVDHSVNTYVNQKHFIENAAHELQTPIAISLNRLELLSEEEGLSEVHLEAIGKVMSTLERLSRLNRSLLLISKIENRQYGAVENIVLNELVVNLSKEYEELAAIKNISIAIVANTTIELHMNRDLCVVMLANLLKNSITHSPAGGEIRIAFGLNTLTISNQGLPLAFDANKLFDRFQKGGNGSNGLGLAIVKSITLLYNFNITYHYEGQHNFKLSF